jgi:hypothetical protein
MEWCVRFAGVNDAITERTGMLIAYVSRTCLEIQGTKDETQYTKDRRKRVGC